MWKKGITARHGPQTFTFIPPFKVACTNSRAPSLRARVAFRRLPFLQNLSDPIKRAAGRNLPILGLESFCLIVLSCLNQDFNSPKSSYAGLHSKDVFIYTILIRATFSSHAQAARNSDQARTTLFGFTASACDPKMLVCSQNTLSPLDSECISFN